MDIHQILKDLYQQLNAVDDAIETLEKIRRRRLHASSLRETAAGIAAQPNESKGKQTKRQVEGLSQTKQNPGT